jgi:hypothetical protein
MRQFHADRRSGGGATTVFDPSNAIQSTRILGVSPRCLSLARRLDCAGRCVEPASSGTAMHPETGTGSHMANGSFDAGEGVRGTGIDRVVLQESSCGMFF